MPHKHYVPALDGLRAFAIALVVLHHVSYRALPGGRIGVDVFFVLSGFLITGVLLREQQARGRVSLLAFYARRALRLMPALTVMVAVELVFGLAFGGPGPNKWGSAAAAVAYLMDFVRAFSKYAEVSAVGHTWSLAVEEHFYIVWPLLLGLLVPLRVAWRVPAILAGAAAVALWRIWLVVEGASADRIYYAFDTRSDQLLIGCALAAWLAGGRSSGTAARLARLWPLALGGVMLVSMLGDGGGAVPWANAIGPDVTAAFAAVLILELVRKPGGIPARIAATRPMVALGQLSYSIYLWHWPILIDTRFHSESKALAAAAIAVSIPVAALSYRYVERPFLKLKRRFERGDRIRLTETPQTARG